MIRLAAPLIERKEIESVSRILKSGYFVQGREVQRFERAVADYVSAKYAVAVSSGTAALHLALVVLGIGRGDEVIVPDFTYPATANVVELVGARPVFVDIDINTFTIDVEKIEERLTRKTKAIVPVHLFGQAAAMDKITEIAKKHGLFIIEDAACALGAEYKGRKCSALGDIGCISFHPRKIITTGEGGMLITNNKDIAKRASIMRNHGIDINRHKIDFLFAGYNYRMTEMQAAMGIEQMKKVNRIILDRQRIAGMYEHLFRGVSWLRTPCIKEGNNHTFQSYILTIIRRAKDRDKLMSYLRRMGIEVNIGTYALHELLFYKRKYKFKKRDFTSSSKAYHNCFAIPVHHALEDRQIEFIVSSIRNFYA